MGGGQSVEHYELCSSNLWMTVRFVGDREKRLLTQKSVFSGFTGKAILEDI